MRRINHPETLNVSVLWQKMVTNESAGEHWNAFCLKRNVFSLVCFLGQVVLGNGGVAGEDRAEILSGKADWGSSSLESADKKESNEISGCGKLPAQQRSFIFCSCEHRTQQ